MRCEIRKKYCTHCKAMSKIFLSSIDREICDNCRRAIYTPPRKCLRCDKDFIPVGDYNRICNICTNKNGGIELYEYHN